MKNKWWYGILFLASNLVFVIRLLSSSFENNLKFVQCDVGQGDSVLFYYKNLQILYDSGGGDKVLNCLEKHIPVWDREIELVIASHGDKDHIGGFDEVMKNYNINKFVWNGVDKESDEWSNLKKNIEENEIEVFNSFDLQQIQIGEMKIDFLWPDEEYVMNESDFDQNDWSVVAKVDFQKCSILLTGDIGDEVEYILLNKQMNVRSDVLKIAHHGSKYSTSEDFVNEVNPKIAMIGVGKNSYGHPHDKILSKLRQLGIFIARTDEMGDLVFESDGEKIRYENEEERVFECF